MQRPEDLFLQPEPDLDLKPSEGGSKGIMQAIMTAQAIASIVNHHAWSGQRIRMILLHRAWNAIIPQVALPKEFTSIEQVQ